MDDQCRYVALVTGATGGMGTAICKQLAKEGYRVVATYKTKEKADRWKKEMQELGFYFDDLYQVDVADFEAVGQMVQAIEQQVGGIDVLVNSAGMTLDGQFRKMTFERWDMVIKVNLYGVFNCCRHVINPMIERGYGRIINISSISAQKGQFGEVNYAAAKAGIHGLTKTLALEVARKGITVNTISPGYIATDMVMAIPEEIRTKRILPEIPVGRFGSTEEVARLVAFLASPESSFITGANYTINGGHHMY
ncbi:MAG: acetoacetyl-CoA reductase [Cytophagales bacterium]|nr:acetoacetyl-CoA reductase [Bernardetiaceae bacterium]MDW8211802.1 acetoacetyl-CoA reductase [Cytophagales bacterium]